MDDRHERVLHEAGEQERGVQGSAVRLRVRSSALQCGAVCLALIACDRTPAPAATTDAAPAASGATTPTASVAPKANPVEAELLALTKHWNDALAKRDAEALRSVYGANVRLYTNTVARDTAVKTKAAALASAKDYTQSLRAVEIDLRDRERPRATFDKKWTANGKESALLASLVFAKEDGKWVVVEESDVPSDQRRARAEANTESCEGLVVAVAASTPEGTRLLGAPTNPSGGHASNGLRVGGGPPESPTYSVAFHENHDDHLATLAWFDVDPKTGKVVNTNDDTVQAPDAALVAKMKTACAEP